MSLMGSKYKTRIEWRRANKKDYMRAYNLGCLNEICDVMGWEKPEVKNLSGHWSKERCIESALPYKTRTDWRNNCKSAATAADRNGWVEECCTHMIIKRRCWTLDECKEEGLKFSARYSWQKGHSASYSAAKKNKWLDECCAHMKVMSKHWTKIECVEIAKQFEYPSDWEKTSPNSYSAARRGGWYDECTAHMGRKIKPRGYWDDKERCIEVIMTCKNKEEIKQNHPSVFGSIRRNGWYYELTDHFDKPLVWGKETLREEANKYETKSEFTKNSNGAYQVALKNGWLEYVIQDIKVLKTVPNHWNNKENCIDVAKGFKTRKEFIKTMGGAYGAMRRNGWVEEICEICGWDKPIPTPKKYPNGYFQIKKNVLSTVEQFDTYSQWRSNNLSAYQSARLNGWVNYVKKHYGIK